MRWKDEAQEKLKRYDWMHQALVNIPMEIKRLKDDAVNLRSAADGVAVRGGGGKREDALINNLVQQQELEKNLKQVRQWLSVMDRSLSSMDPEDQLVLNRLFLYPQRDAINQLCSELGVEQATVYRKRDRALYRFTVALYGFPET